MANTAASSKTPTSLRAVRKPRLTAVPKDKLIEACLGCGNNIVVADHVSLRLLGSDEFLGAIHAPPMNVPIGPNFICLKKAWGKVKEQITVEVGELVLVLNDRTNPTSTRVQFTASSLEGKSRATTRFEDRRNGLRRPQDDNAPGSAVKFVGTASKHWTGTHTVATPGNKSFF